MRQGWEGGACGHCGWLQPFEEREEGESWRGRIATIAGEAVQAIVVALEKDFAVDLAVRRPCTALVLSSQAPHN